MGFNSAFKVLNDNFFFLSTASKGKVIENFEFSPSAIYIPLLNNITFLHFFFILREFLVPIIYGVHCPVSKSAHFFLLIFISWDKF